MHKSTGLVPRDQLPLQSECPTSKQSAVVSWYDAAEDNAAEDEAAKEDHAEDEGYLDK